MRSVAAGAALAVFLSRAAALPPIVLEHFPIGLPGVDASNAALIAALDHKGAFYTQCCDSTIVAFTGETAERGGTTLFCPAPPDFPTCFITAGCVCGYEHPTGASYVVNGNYLGSLVGPSILSYDGHAGYDYGYPAATPLVATKAGMLCKALEDFINGRQGFPTAWDKFHTFYVDHGTVAGAGFASWYLHASVLEGALASLTPGSCAPVASGQVIARVGNQGTILPHLHFEVRRYVPADGPEAATSKVVDPYGWTGSTPDPWEDPQENPQAAYNPTSLWGSGGPPPACSPAPLAGCTVGSKSRLSMRHRPPAGQDRLSWRFRGAAVDPADLGDPRVDTRFALCFYASTPASLEVPAGSLCSGDPCWRGLGRPPGSKGFRYWDPAAATDGVSRVLLHPGDVRQGRADLDGRGDQLTLPALPVGFPLRVQLQGGNGSCFEATFSAAGVTRNDARLFLGRADAAAVRGTVPGQ